MLLRYATDLVIDRVDLVDEGANSEAFIKICKRKESAPSMDLDQILGELKAEHATVINEAISKARAEVPEEIASELAKAKSDLDVITGEKKALEDQMAIDAELAKGRKEEEDLEEVLKSANPIVKAAFETVTKQKEAAEALAKSLNQEKEDAEILSKAKELPAIPASEEDLVKMLKGVTPEVFEVLKSANKLIEESPAFKELGKGKGSAGTGDAWDRIEKMADAISKEQGVTQAEAIKRVIKANAALYKEYLEGSAN